MAAIWSLLGARLTYALYPTDTFAAWVISRFLDRNYDVAVCVWARAACGPASKSRVQHDFFIADFAKPSVAGTF